MRRRASARAGSEAHSLSRYSFCSSFVGANEQPELAGEPRARLAAQGEGYPLQRLPLTIGAAGEGSGHLLQALGEDPPVAGGLIAEELPDPDPQAHRRAAPRQVGQRTNVTSMKPARRLIAQRTFGCGTLRRSMDAHRVPVEGDPVNVQLFGDGEAAAVWVCVGHGPSELDLERF